MGNSASQSLTENCSSSASSEGGTRPLPVRHRMDLVIRQTGSEAVPRYTLKDPATDRYFQLRQADYFVFSQLNGSATLESIQSRYTSTYAPQQISQEHILNFVQRLVSQGLVILDRFGSGELYKDRSQKLIEGTRRQRLTSLLAIRFRGVDPDRWLTTCSPLVNWCFSPLMLLISLVLLLGAGTLAVSEWETIARELPQAGIFLQSPHLLWFLATFGTIKVLHELAHAFACKRFGGECHELGVMLLAFTPCLYCNVSDSWLLRSRWHRIAVAGAGIYLELFLATVCFFIWYWTVPGLIHTTALYVMVIGTVSTILLNGNPLLRYDGYYILADLVDVPNLRARSQGLLTNCLSQICLGVRGPDPLRGEAHSRWGLAIYGVLSGAYVWIVVFAILWMLYQVLKPYGLQPLAVVLGIVTIMTRLTMLGSSVTRAVLQAHSEGVLNRLRLTVSLCVLTGLLTGLLLLPVPRRVVGPCLIEAGRTTPVYVTSPGRLNTVELSAGDFIDSGELLAQLKNHDLERTLLELQSKVERQNRRIELLTLRQSQDPNSAAELPAARSTLLEYQNQLQQKQQDVERLQLRAPHPGVILPGDWSALVATHQNGFEPTGTPDAPRNARAWLDVGTLLCRVAVTDAADALLYLPQADATLLTIGTSVRISTAQTSGRPMLGEVIEIAATPLREIPPTLLKLNLIPFEAGANGQLIPALPTHEVRVRLERPDSSAVSPVHLIPGEPGRGVIYLAREPIGTLILRELRRTFTFAL